MTSSKTGQWRAWSVSCVRTNGGLVARGTSRISDHAQLAWFMMFIRHLMLRRSIKITPKESLRDTPIISFETVSLRIYTHTYHLVLLMSIFHWSPYPMIVRTPPPPCGVLWAPHGTSHVNLFGRPAVMNPQVKPGLTLNRNTCFGL